MTNCVMEIGEVNKVKLHGHIDASIAPSLMGEFPVEREVLPQVLVEITLEKKIFHRR